MIFCVKTIIFRILRNEKQERYHSMHSGRNARQIKLTDD